VWDGVHRAWHASHRDPCAECARLAFIEQTLAETRAATLHRYRLDAGRYAEMTLDRYRPDPAYPSQAVAKAAVRRLVDAWARGDWSAGIVLSSPDVGIGKTHLAIAAAREGVMRYRPRIGERVLAVWDMPTFVEAVRHTYRDDRAPDPLASAQEPVILVLDDLGTEHVTLRAQTWYQDLMFRLFHARWVASRATVVTTNLDANQLCQRLGDRVYSRLISLADLPVQMRGQDHRLRHLRPPHPKP
jgi:DNA replication protein DnaC